MIEGCALSASMSSASLATFSLTMTTSSHAEWLAAGISSPAGPRINGAIRGSWAAVARARTVAGYAIPGIIVFFFWVVVVILVIILLAFIVHWAGGGVLNLRLGHFDLNVGFT